MPKRILARRYFVLLTGIFIMALGVVLSVKGALGTAPIASLPYVLSEICPALSFGTFSFFTGVAYFLLQLPLTWRNFRWEQLLQIAIALFFGKFEDVWLWLLRWLTVESYPGRFACMLLGCAVTAAGISMMYVSQVTMDSAHALLKTLEERFSVPFGRLKVANDVFLVCSAAVLALVFLRRLVGVREGTVIAAVLVGTISGWLNPRLKKRLGRFLGYD